QIPSAAGKMPIDVPSDLERAELVADVGELRPYFGRFALQQPNGVFREDVGVNVDGLRHLATVGSLAREGRGPERNALRWPDRVADAGAIVVGCAPTCSDRSLDMLDQSAASHHIRLRDHPRLDFQDHLADLEAKGLLVRVDRPINKDTELHPLVRWQFLGGVPEDKRRAFLFTHVTDSKGWRYDIPVAVGAL